MMWERWIMSRDSSPVSFLRECPALCVSVEKEGNSASSEGETCVVLCELGMLGPE
jgi:hypothetical protein